MNDSYISVTRLKSHIKEYILTNMTNLESTLRLNPKSEPWECTDEFYIKVQTHLDSIADTLCEYTMDRATHRCKGSDSVRVIIQDVIEAYDIWILQNQCKK